MEIERRLQTFADGTYGYIYHKKDDVHCWHREDGPAIISYNKDDSIQFEEYCINGVIISKEEWEKEYGWKLQLKGTPMGKIFK